MAKYKVKDLFTKDVHVKILTDNQDNIKAAAKYNEHFGSEVVSRQLVRYWRSIFLDNGGKVATTNNHLKETRKLIKPSPTDDVGDTFIPEMCHRILAIGDLHCPYMHPDTIEFLRYVKSFYVPDAVVQIGDELDNHGISFHDSDPNLDSAGVELEKGKLQLEELHELFPNMMLCDSNHGSLVYRRAKAHGLPIQMIKKYRDILFPDHGAEGWSWADAWVLNTPLGKIKFQHQYSGDILLAAAHEGMSVAAGHLHGRFSVTYAANSDRLYFGAQVGCLIDPDSYAFAYGKLHKHKPILGVTLFTDGSPQLVPMLLDKSGR